MTGMFAGQTALITGAASGIGEAVAQHFSQRGARVVGVDRSEALSEATARLPGTGHLAIVADLTEESAAERVRALSRSAVWLRRVCSCGENQVPALQSSPMKIRG